MAAHKPHLFLNYNNHFHFKNIYCVCLFFFFFRTPLLRVEHVSPVVFPVSPSVSQSLPLSLRVSPNVSQSFPMFPGVSQWRLRKQSRRPETRERIRNK